MKKEGILYCDNLSLKKYLLTLLI